jgi:Tfp pilus assembly protein PilX
MTPIRRKHHQQGVSLLIVMVMVLLSMLLVLGGSRMAILNESVVGIDTDYQRAFEAAQAMLADAELDLLGLNTAGTICAGAACRTTASPVFFPRDMLEYQDLVDQLTTTAAGGNPPCLNGICLDLGAQTSGDPTTSFWNNPSGNDADWGNARTLAAFTASVPGFNERGAYYGEYTGAVYSATSGNPFLNNAVGKRVAWYWIEILPYTPSAAVQSGNAAFWSPPNSLPLVYRITALAQGRKPGTMAVVQSYVVPDPLRAGP